ncbi:MAG: DNA polymerase III subunit delta [Candidatus Omnitrophica bacterium]|nr:DNA polymerase III subunit delta [Candidatus Omnitrophota bacterium]
MVSGKPAPVHLLYGNDEFLFEERLLKLKKELVRTNPDFNYNLFYVSDAQPETILEAARTLPFLNPCRMVVVKEVEKLKAEGKEALISYSKKPQPSTCMILVYFAEKEPRGDKLFSELKHFSERLSSPQGEKLTVWIQQEAKLRGKEIARDAISLLEENLGNNLKEISLALDKLSAYAGSRHDISPADVQKLTGRITSEDIFRLMDAIVNNDISRAMKIVSDKLKEGKDPTEIIGTLSWGVKGLLFARLWQDQRLPLFKIRENLNSIRVFQNQDAILTQSRRISPIGLKQKINLLFQADLSSKTKNLPRAMLLEILLMQLSGQSFNLKV